MNCNFWYLKYQTKKQCEDQLDQISVKVTETEEMKTTSTAETSTETETTLLSVNEGADADTSVSVVTTTEVNTPVLIVEEDFVTDFGFSEEVGDTTFMYAATPVEPTTITAKKEGATEKVVQVHIETSDFKIKLKKRKNIDGEVMTIVVIAEVGAIATVACLLYFGMKLFGHWFRRGRYYNLDQAERSHLPLNQHQAANPEDTIRPRIQEDFSDENDSDNDNDDSDDGDDNDTPVGYSTAIETTQQTNTTALGFSPIGPCPNRTVSMSGLNTDNRATRFQPRSSSGPIPINMDAEIEDEDILDASQLLQQPPLRTVDAIIHGQSDEGHDATNERRYPLRKRNAPERYGYSSTK